jgi:hypothetical protein
MCKNNTVDPLYLVGVRGQLQYLLSEIDIYLILESFCHVYNIYAVTKIHEI